MQVDIFISYKATDSGATTEDAARADALYRALVQKGYRVFFSKMKSTSGIPSSACSVSVKRDRDFKVSERRLLWDLPLLYLTY